MNQKELYEKQVQASAVAVASASGVPLGRREAALLDWISSSVRDMAPKSEVRFAELSIGDGQLSRALARTIPAARIYCVDISPSRLEYSRRMALAESAAMAGRMRFLELNLDTAFGRLERGQYDAVIAIDVLEHVFDAFGFVRNCRELLKSDGWLFLRVPNLCYIKRRFAVFAGHLPVTSSWFDTPGSYRSWKERHGWDGGHLHFFTMAALRWLLEDEGFQCHAWGDIGAHAEAIRRIWPGMLFGNIAVSARKLDRPSNAPAG
jgi:2-polyprenyl-3-methyl-5-hydroxy-6-metoxy-1,4-benzoquinol methylase